MFASTGVPVHRSSRKPRFFQHEFVQPALWRHLPQPLACAFSNFKGTPCDTRNASSSFELGAAEDAALCPADWALPAIFFTSCLSPAVGVFFFPGGRDSALWQRALQTQLCVMGRPTPAVQAGTSAQLSGQVSAAFTALSLPAPQTEPGAELQIVSSVASPPVPGSVQALPAPASLQALPAPEIPPALPAPGLAASLPPDEAMRSDQAETHS